MKAGDTLYFFGLTLATLTGIVSAEWDVKYQNQTICAVKGSTVVLPCEYTYPNGQNPKMMMWCHEDSDCLDTEYVIHSENTGISSQYKNRGIWLGDNVKNCTLKIQDLRKEDSGKYTFRFNTDQNHWAGQPGMTLQVVELKVMKFTFTEKQEVKEGDSVNLTCHTEICSLTQLEFSWFKNQLPLSETHSTIHFNPVYYKDSGIYTCTLKNNEPTVSEEYNLVVESESSPVVFVIVGILLAILVVSFVTVIYFKKRKESLMEENDNGGRRQIEENQIHTNPGECNTQTSPQRQEVSPQEDELCYAAVQFENNQPSKRSVPSRQEIQEDTVVYSAVSR